MALRIADRESGIGKIISRGGKLELKQNIKSAKSFPSQGLRNYFKNVMGEGRGKGSPVTQGGGGGG